MPTNDPPPLAEIIDRYWLTARRPQAAECVRETPRPAWAGPGLDVTEKPTVVKPQPKE
jgi:hypothetical protein